MIDPQPTRVELLVRHVLLPREILQQIEINTSHSKTGNIMNKKRRHPAQEPLEWGKSPFAMMPLAAYLYDFLVRLIKRVRRTKRSHNHRKF
jgi:hypothetical protein